ncbi:MAG: helix-hairpin-helix domain-containing protein [Desulfobacteraceae bacterium]|nr:helix-hairpin-helix domain-containing protein [Desulfobacteraceae bacterium]
MRKVKKALMLLLLLCLFVVFSTPVMAENKVNINTADQVELCTLKNIGEKYAKRIIEYRKEHKFEKPEEIMEVKGIGSKTYKLNKDRIIVEDKKS